MRTSSRPSSRDGARSLGARAERVIAALVDLLHAIVRRPLSSADGRVDVRGQRTLARVISKRERSIRFARNAWRAGDGSLGAAVERDMDALVDSRWLASKRDSCDACDEVILPRAFGEAVRACVMNESARVPACRQRARRAAHIATCRREKVDRTDDGFGCFP